MSSNEMGMGEGTLTKAAGLVAEAKQDFDRLSGKLEGQIAALQGKWAGAGGQAFFTLHRAWTEKQKVIVSALNEFEGALVGTEKDAMGTDDAQATNYSRNLNRLGG
ncbi:WXG100 family type VII secretion target [Nocardioides coralli]|uniref:WXG100 family type VII secretion target n=1 Tax=Nocardioides coralli TaxID=2872154 RepID=UPI001CA41ECC|nr:WXG100 family type VII secretion target [Nocardioides coralli]QZY29331.1 WXG100 family type VII secretion target [Nocardioides coralli]